MSENNGSVHVFSILIHFFAIPCKTTTSNEQIKDFAENVKTRQVIFISLFDVEKHPYEVSSRAIQSH